MKEINAEFIRKLLLEAERCRVDPSLHIAVALQGIDKTRRGVRAVREEQAQARAEWEAIAQRLEEQLQEIQGGCQHPFTYSAPNADGVYHSVYCSVCDARMPVDLLPASEGGETG
jgi:hypothetical protein